MARVARLVAALALALHLGACHASLGGLRSANASAAGAEVEGGASAGDSGDAGAVSGAGAAAGVDGAGVGVSAGADAGAGASAEAAVALAQVGAGAKVEGGASAGDSGDAGTVSGAGAAAGVDGANVGVSAGTDAGAGASAEAAVALAQVGAAAIAREESGDVSVQRTECIVSLTNLAIRKVSPWSSSQTAYKYVPVDVHPSKRLALPTKLVTDCSGFVSWVIQQGCGRKGRALYKRLWALSKEKRDSGGVKQVRAKGFYYALTSGKGGRDWRLQERLTSAQHGDLLVYRIKHELSGCSSHGGQLVGDTGHIMIVTGEPFRDTHPKTAQQCPGLKRYKLKVADSSKVIHWAGKYEKDSRASCEDTRFFNSKPGCGVGTGWIYAWADRRGRLVAVALRPPAGKAHDRVGRACPPSQNQRCHAYAIGRLSLDV